MIKVKHPDEGCNKVQELRIKSLGDPQEIEHQEIFYSYANAAYRYHQKTGHSNPTVEQWHGWLSGLPENIKADMG